MHIWYVLLEKTLESPLDCKEIQSVHSEDQPWDFFGRNDAKAETPGLWPPHTKSWFIGKDPDAGRDWGQEEGTTEDEMAGWHHWLDGRESGWTPGVGDGQGGLACCSSWGRKESDTTERLIWSDLICLNVEPGWISQHPVDSSQTGFQKKANIQTEDFRRVCEVWMTKACLGGRVTARGQLQQAYVGQWAEATRTPVPTFQPCSHT